MDIPQRVLDTIADQSAAARSAEAPVVFFEEMLDAVVGRLDRCRIGDDSQRMCFTAKCESVIDDDAIVVGLDSAGHRSGAIWLVVNQSGENGDCPWGNE